LTEAANIDNISKQQQRPKDVLIGRINWRFHKYKQKQNTDKGWRQHAIHYFIILKKSFNILQKISTRRKLTLRETRT